MIHDLQTNDRRSGILLVAFVALQIVYLTVNVGVIAPPAPDAPIEELRTTVVDHADTIRWHTLLALASFFCLFLPGIVGLRERLPHHPSRDILGVSVVLILASVVLMVTSLGVLGLVPPQDLSDSLLRGIFMFDAYSAWVVGNVITAIFLTAASTALLCDDTGPRWLGRAGLLAATAGILGSLWIVNGDVHGALFGLAVLSRALWLGWVAAAGIWLIRTAAPVRHSDEKRDRAAAAALGSVLEG